MKNPQYTQEELAIVNEWGVPSDKEFDFSRKAYTADGKTRITALVLAKQRKDILEKKGLQLIGDNNFEKAV